MAWQRKARVKALNSILRHVNNAYRNKNRLNLDELVSTLMNETMTSEGTVRRYIEEMALMQKVSVNFIDVVTLHPAVLAARKVAEAEAKGESQDGA